MTKTTWTGVCPSKVEVFTSKMYTTYKERTIQKDQDIEVVYLTVQGESYVKLDAIDTTDHIAKWISDANNYNDENYETGDTDGTDQEANATSAEEDYGTIGE